MSSRSRRPSLSISLAQLFVRVVQEKCDRLCLFFKGLAGVVVVIFLGPSPGMPTEVFADAAHPYPFGVTFKLSLDNADGRFGKVINDPSEAFLPSTEAWTTIYAEEQIALYQELGIEGIYIHEVACWLGYSKPDTALFGGTIQCRYKLAGNIDPSPTLGTYVAWTFSYLPGIGKTCPVDPDATVGNPCNAMTGNKFEAETDYQSADGSLDFTRHYNSQLGSLLRRDIGLGYGWTSPYHKNIALIDEPSLSNGPGIYSYRSGGIRQPYLQNAGQWQGDADNKLRLSQDANGYTLRRPDGGQEQYDTSGKILSETDGSGRTTSYAYNAAEQLDTISGPFGHSLTFGYYPPEHAAAGHLHTVTDAAGQVIAYQYDGNDNLIQVTYPDGNGKRYHYEDSLQPHHLTGISIIDTLGQETRFSTYGYDTEGGAILTQHAQTDNSVPQERFTISDRNGTQATVTDAAGNIEVLTFDMNLGVNRLLSKIHQSDNKGIHKTYDANNNLETYTDAEGNVTKYAYNAYNQLWTKTEAFGTTEARTTTISEYVSEELDLPVFMRRPSVKVGRYAETEIRYGSTSLEMPCYGEPLTLPCQITQYGSRPDGTPIAHTVSMKYNVNGQVIEIDGPRTDVNDVTTLAYYECTTGAECGQLQSVVNALGQETTYDFYYPDGRLKQLTDPNGMPTTYTYDVRGRVETVTQTPLGGAARVTQYGYTAFGAIETVTTPDGVTVTYGYDAAQDLRRITDNLGNTIEYDYDVRGNRSATRINDPNGTLVRTVETAYNARNHLDTLNATGSVTTLTTDAVGNLRDVIDPNNNADGTLDSTSRTHDPLNRLRETIDLLAGVTGYDYDVNDRLTRVQAPNGATTDYVYDDFGNLLQETSPDRGTIVYTNDAAGNVTTTTDARGIEAVYTYDALNRRTRVGPAGTEQAITYAYDSCAHGTGRLCQIQDASGTTQYAYDAFGDIVEQNRTMQGVTYTTQYTYDAANRVTSITYPDGRVIGYVRDAIGRIESVTLTVDGVTTTLSGNRTYRADRRLTGQTFGNGLTETRTYDLKGQLQTQRLGTVATRDYLDYDANGNLKALTADSFSGTYTYDALNRLGTETAGTLTQSLGYDANGNRTSDGTGDYDYLAASNRLSVLNGTAVTLDAAGNLTDDGQGQRYTYNDGGHLATVTRDEVQVAAYTYDAWRLRTRKVTPWGTALYHYDLAGNLILETTATGLPFKAYVWADGVPVAQINLTAQGDTLTYLHTDHLNTPRVGTDANGAVVWRWEGEAFGATLADEDPDGDNVTTTVNLRFPGQYYDQETGLHYNWNRYYDPRIGRYITSDPIGLQGGLNTFAYAGLNPLRFTDPFGLFDPGPKPPAPRLGSVLGKAARVCLRVPPPIIIIIGGMWPGSTGGCDDTGKCSDTRDEDGDGPHRCEIWYNDLILRQIQIDHGMVKGGSDDLTKRRWDRYAKEYNRVCVPQGFKPITNFYF